MLTKGMRQPDLKSPYVDFTLRLHRAHAKRLEAPSQPEVVAADIHHALETDQPKLLYPVGEEALHWITGRQSVTDEEWIDLGDELTDQDLAARYRKYVAMEI